MHKIFDIPHHSISDQYIADTAHITVSRATIRSHEPHPTFLVLGWLNGDQDNPVFSGRAVSQADLIPMVNHCEEILLAQAITLQNLRERGFLSEREISLRERAKILDPLI